MCDFMCFIFIITGNKTERNIYEWAILSLRTNSEGRGPFVILGEHQQLNLTG